MDEGEIEVESVLPITLADITPELARASGFKGVVDLLKVAKHGRGENVYLVRFHYVPPAKANAVTAGAGLRVRRPKHRSYPAGPSAGGRKRTAGAAKLD